ncbi:uncharacterized protein RAG0_11102 [Rhynchosporium agropyri]|uniref:Uncharacterized protein n=1 Tax=Rhynchosporium agropyri TaxID=914238 RepID=A0A1E1L2L7_9HELO|nr:uncharacterized protein RAG0_11102 [Rhynchosporium agropyri]
MSRGNVGKEIPHQAVCTDSRMHEEKHSMGRCVCARRTLGRRSGIGGRVEAVRAARERCEEIKDGRAHA